MLQVPKVGAPARRGVVLLVVMALLALFAAVGLGFVYYADSEAVIAGNFLKASGNVNFSGGGKVDLDPNQLLAFFLSQLIYDTDDKSSALRGHSLARNIYGYDPANPAANSVPFTGVGRLRYNLLCVGTPKDNYNLINYTHFKSTADSFFREPDPKEGGPSWTYPDNDSLFLAALDPDGNVLAPSFYRWYNGGSWIGPEPWQKYLTLRPHRTYHTQFADPPDPGGDVHNWEFGKGTKNPGGGPNFNNDSFWVDLGYPVMTGPNGLKYKVLFAPLIIDLDGKINLNSAGNLRKAGQHASNQGLGPWEINLAKVLNQADLVNLFKGITSPQNVTGRYGADNNPAVAGAVFPPKPGAPPRFYGPTDWDGVDNPSYAASKRFLLPGDAGNSNPLYFMFPDFALASFGNGDAFERTNHPMLANVLKAVGDDRIIAAKHLEALLRFGTPSITSASSDLFLLSPLNFLNKADPAGSARRRLMVTTDSYGLGQPGKTPWLKYGDPATAYTLVAPNPYPTGAAQPLPAPGAWPTNNGEYDMNGRGFVLPFGSRLNLNRDLTDYPPPNPVVITDTATFDKAQKDRQALAKDIFDTLRLVCTGGRPTDPINKAALPADQYEALRWLAQLAANIVDYRDADDYSTPFNWDTADPSDLTRWVFGVEMPRVVINEAYAEVSNDPADPGLAMNMAMNPYKCNFWVELANPFKDDGQSTARLQVPVAASPTPYPCYKLTIGKIPAGPLFTDPLGTPDAPSTVLEVADFLPEDAPTPQPLAGVDYTVILPAGPNYGGTNGKNEGFYLLGPKFNFPGTNAAPPQATLRIKDQMIGGVKSAMTYDMPLATNLMALPTHNLYLRRLACPLLPPQVDPTQPLYNPYVTVDYVEGIQTFDGVAATDMGVNGNMTAVNARSAKGRRQPFAATPLVVQTPDINGGTPAIDPYTDCPQHTFFRHNAIEPNNPNPGTPGQTLSLPFDWLVHLDRQLNNPIELLQVSAVKPFELTQKFITPGGKHTHRAPWYDDAARLFRFLEYADSGWRSNGVSLHGRIPGLLNINTLWVNPAPTATPNPEIFQALCDCVPGLSSYQPTEVDTIFGKLVSSRTPTGIPGPNDKPYRALATAITGTEGIENTLLRADPADPNPDPRQKRRLFEVTPNQVAPPGDPNHPFLKMELLAKIANNVTTRSNVFAVWITVGFFEVVDDTAIPPKLGKEVGKDDGSNIRHRMFAIVDRSDLRMFTVDPSKGDATTSFTAIGPNKYSVQVQLKDPKTGTLKKTLNMLAPNGKQWGIQPGMRLEISTAPFGEGAVVESVDGPNLTFVVNLRTPPPPNTPIVCRGNMGPWPGYDHRKDSRVVIHSTVIE